MKYMQIMHLFSNVIETNVKWGAVTASIEIVFTVSLVGFLSVPHSAQSIFLHNLDTTKCVVEYAELT